MKFTYKIIAAWLLIFALLFSAVGCDLLPGVDSSQSGVGSSDFYIDGESKLTMTVGDSLTLTIVSSDDSSEVKWTSSSSSATVEKGIVKANSPGTAIIKASQNGNFDQVIITIVAAAENKPGNTITPPDAGDGENADDPVGDDPYVGVDEDEFYANYTPAISYNDAKYRTQHNLMSGNIGDQDQAPTISEHRPMIGGRYVRNNTYIFSKDGNTYYVVDYRGEIVMEIYRGGAYILLEEVAAYVFAFGEPPANHSYSKKTKPYNSPWGIYLRVNNTVFSGSTSKYPYEPELPRISGCGGDLTYYEMDIGTTGTDCDPEYYATDYNNGSKITRGAARIVYSCEDRNGNKIIDLDERFVFYTYNHYNDFQEYLNYLGGWGEMFGNVTGGGTLSSKYNCNPTPYVETVRAPITDGEIIVIYYYVPKNEWAV